jgi:hypothetical protein
LRDHLLDDVSSVVVDIGSFHTRAGNFSHLIIDDRLQWRGLPEERESIDCGDR